MNTQRKEFELHFITENFPLERITLNAGDFLFKEGEQNDFVYFIESGSIKVLKNQWVIGITHSMEFVGITSCISENMTYTFSSKSVKESTLLKIKKLDFQKLLLKNPKFCKSIIEILCQRIKATDIKTRSFLEQSSKHRLITELINNSSNVEDSIKTFLGIDDLSELTGVSKRAVRKMLNDLTKVNLILHTKENEIILLDQLALKQLVDKKIKKLQN